MYYSVYTYTTHNTIYANAHIKQNKNIYAFVLAMMLSLDKFFESMFSTLKHVFCCVYLHSSPQFVCLLLVFQFAATRKMNNDVSERSYNKKKKKKNREEDEHVNTKTRKIWKSNSLYSINVFKFTAKLVDMQRKM